MKTTFFPTALAVGISLSMPAQASTDQELTEIRQMVSQMKQQYEQRIQQLEQRLAQAEQHNLNTKQHADQSARQLAALQQQLDTGNSGNRFNPAISLVLQGAATSYQNDPEEYHLEGLPLGGEAGLHEEGLGLIETELTASANVDNLFYGQATLGLHAHEGETELDLEEAFLDTLALPAGLGLRFGRFASAIGYLNSHHSHNWDFADAPLAYQAFLGKQYRDDGLRATWLAPTDNLLLEFGAELLRGGSYPAGEPDSNLGAVRHGFINLGGDIGLKHSWQLGLSHMDIDARHRGGAGHGHGHEGDSHAEAAFDGDSRIQSLDLVWKTQLANGRQWILQGEYFLRDEDGTVLFDEEGEQALMDYTGDQKGWYLQSVLQLNPQWRAGLRYDRLSISNNLGLADADLDGNSTALDGDEVLEESGYHSEGYSPYRWSAMLDWNPSEFSRIRLQYNRDNSQPDTDHQLMLQYIMSFGAHGAHQY